MGHDVSAEDAREALATLTNHHHPEGARVKRRATQTIEAYIADHEGEDYTFERDVLPGRAAEEAMRAAGAPPMPDEGPDPLLDLTVADLKSALEHVDDAERLDALLDVEERTTAVDAILDRMDELVDDEGEDEEDEEDEEDLQTSTGEGGSLEDAPGT